MKNYLKTVLAAFFIISFIFTLTSCSKNNTETNSNTNDIYQISDDNFFQMDGTISDYTGDTITITMANGDSYTFSTEGAEISKSETEIAAGNSAIIGFYGALNDFAEVQKAKVAIIAVGENPADFYAKNTLASMSLEEKVGQMFFARCPDGNAAADVKTYHLGGYILFGRDFKEKTKQEVIDNIASYQSASDIGMFIGVDEEGGDITRISRFTEFRSEPFPSPSELRQNGGIDAVKSDTKEKAALLTSLGVNVNFAPVCDVPSAETDYIYNRAYSTDSSLCAQFAEAVTTVSNENGVIACLKHFPGYGNNTDTHTGIAYDERSYESFEKCDFIPFKSGIKAGAKFIMVSHNIVKCMDENSPASLSPAVHKILRETLGYEGIMITDDISMEGITQYTDNANAAVTAVLAGNDMLCCTDYKSQIPAVINAVNDGTISEETINDSVYRILKIKYQMGIAQ